MLKLNVVGQVYGTSGYAIHTANVIRELIKLGVDVSLETNPFPGWEFNEFKENIQKNYPYDDTLMIVTPEWLEVKSGDRIKKLCCYGVFEGTKVPPYWVDIAKKDYVYKIIVPSQHTKQAWINGGLSENKLIIIPHGYNPVFKPEGKKKFNDDVFRFLFVGGWRNGPFDRKRVDLLVRAFCAEFKPEEKVELFLKFNMAYQDQNNIVNQLNILNLPEKRPKIALSFDTVPDEGMAEMYRSCQCFINPTMGESFSIPNLEAVACGVPSLATNFGGQTDFLPKEWLIAIDKMIPAPAEPWIYSWAEWAVPDMLDMQRHMRKAFNGELKGNPELTKGLTWENTARKIKELFE